MRVLAAATSSRLWVANCVPGLDYADVVTSCAGLWAYVMGDTVKFVERTPPRLLVTGRTSYSLSSFGEHLTGGEIEDAVTAAASAIGAQIADFAVGAIFPDDKNSRGGHLFLIEFSTPSPDPAETERFLRTVDDVLSRRNEDYRAHRSGGFGLDPPRLRALPRGSF